MANKSPPAVTFGQLFKFFRIKSGFKTVTQFADALANKNIVYSESLYFHWQVNNKIPTKRKLLLKLIELFIDYSSITHITQANLFLELASKGYLTHSEIDFLPEINTDANANIDDFYKQVEEFIASEQERNFKKTKKTKPPKRIRFNFMMEKNMYDYLNSTAQKNNSTKSEFIRSLIRKHRQNNKN